MADINHERLGKILGRCRSGIFADVMLGSVLPAEFPMMSCAECLGEITRPEKTAVGVGNGVREFMTQDIAQRGVAAVPEM